MSLPEPNPDTTDSRPFAEGATSCLDAGWTPVHIKMPDCLAPTGYTGEKNRGNNPTEARIRRWVQEHGGDNLALRMPEDVIGIDVDHYDGKAGGDTLAALEAGCGPLPDTWLSTSRWPADQTSGIRYYRVPPEVTRWADQPGIEIISHGYRFAFVWPSIGKRTGQVYRWIDPDGQMMEPGDVPHVEDIPALPAAWVERLQRKAEPATGAPEGGADLIFPTGSPYGESAALDEIERLTNTPKGDRNNTLFKVACNLAELVASGDLDRDQTVTAVVSAAQAIGLPEPDDPDEVRKTITSAFKRAKPRPSRVAASILADLDADGPSAHEPKRPSPTATTIPAAQETAPEGTGAPGGGGAGAQGLDYVCDLLGLPHGSLTRFAREEGEDPAYYLFGPRGAGRLSGKSLSDPRALRAAIKTASGAFVQAPRDKAPWVTVVAALDRAEDVIEGGEEGTAAARGRSVLAEYLHRTAPNSAEDGQYPTELAEWGPWPYLLDDGALVVHTKAVAATVNSHRKGVLAAVDPHDVTRWLRDGLGATRVTVKFKAGKKDTTRSMWRVPASGVPGQPPTPPVEEVPWHVLARMPRPPYEP